MELRDSDYQSALRLVQGAADALQGVITSLKRHDEASRIRRGIEETEGILKKVKRDLRIG
jgi:hypothetical protein